MWLSKVYRRLTTHLASEGRKQHTFDSHKTTKNRSTIVKIQKYYALKMIHIVYLSCRGPPYKQIATIHQQATDINPPHP